ncbi:MAG: anti-sigma factor [Pikeienuella sp.]
MTENENERDLDAAERALGQTARGPETPENAAIRQAWEERLAPLSDETPEVQPSAGLLAKIEAEIDSDSTQHLNIVRQQARTWRTIAYAAMSIAAMLALYIAVPLQDDGAHYVAVVTADDGSGAGLIIEIDTSTGLATVIPAGVTPPPGQSYEMWQLPEGAEKPFSLGLLPQNAVLRRKISAAPGDLFAISLEPLGGSPTGQPTQALYHGRVVKVED